MYICSYMNISLTHILERFPSDPAKTCQDLNSLKILKATNHERVLFLRQDMAGISFHRAGMPLCIQGCGC